MSRNRNQRSNFGISLPQFLNIQLHKIVLLLGDVVKCEEGRNFVEAKIAFEKMSQEMLKMEEKKFPENFQNLFRRITFSINKNLHFWDSISKVYLETEWTPELVREECKKIRKILVERRDDSHEVFEPNRAIYFRIFFHGSCLDFRRDVYTTNKILKNKNLNDIYALWLEVDTLFGYLFYSTLTATLHPERMVLENGKVYVGSTYEKRSEDSLVELKFQIGEKDSNPVLLTGKCYTAKEVKVTKEIPKENLKERSSEALSLSKDLIKAYEEGNYCDNLESLKTMADRANSILTQLKFAAVEQQVSAEIGEPERREEKMIERLAENVKIRDLMKSTVFGCSKSPQFFDQKNEEMEGKYFNFAAPSFIDDICIGINTNQNQ